MTAASTSTEIATPPARARGPWVRAWSRFRANGAALTGLAILIPILVAVATYPLWWTFGPNDIDLKAMNQGPGPSHWFGTDGVGRDILARLLQGGRISLTVAFVSVVVSIVIGFLVGAIASFGGKVVDNGIMRLVDLAMTLPPVIFLLVLASIAGTGIVPTIVVISLLSWPVLSRMVRARLLELRDVLRVALPRVGLAHRDAIAQRRRVGVQIADAPLLGHAVLGLVLG